MESKFTTLSLLVTYQCNAECKHCGLDGGPKEKFWMKLDEIYDLTSQASALGILNVVLTGGEPTLIKNADLIDYFRFVKEKTSIKYTRIVTNAWWAKSYTDAYNKLKQWKDAGLDELNVSCGEYHQEFISVQNVANAYKAACDLDYMTVLLAGEFSNKQNPRITPYEIEDAIGEKLNQHFENSPFVTRYRGFNKNKVLRVGRGINYIEDSESNKLEYSKLQNLCSDMMKSISCHPDGNVTPCCGVVTRSHPVLSMANWRKEPLKDISNRIEDDLICCWVRYLGLKDMVNWIKEKDPLLNFEKDVVNICELCNNILANKNALTLIDKYGIERRDDILLNKIIKDSTIYSNNFNY